MKQNKEVLAIIPARGGSKRIPRKNIKPLCGKPLIAYSIEVALHTPDINRVIVSTEDREISQVARKYGAEVPFYRPEKIAEDSSVIGDAIEFTLNELAKTGYTPDIVCELYPTSVFRQPSLLSFLIEKLFAGYNYVKTVKPIKENRNCFFSLAKDGRCIPVFQKKKIPFKNANTFFKSYGLFSGRNLKPSHSFGTYLYNIVDPIHLIDIDNPIDFCMAEKIIKEQLFDFEFK